MLGTCKTLFYDYYHNPGITRREQKRTAKRRFSRNETFLLFIFADVRWDDRLTDFVIWNFFNFTATWSSLCFCKEFSRVNLSWAAWRSIYSQFVRNLIGIVMFWVLLLSIRMSERAISKMLRAFWMCWNINKNIINMRYLCFSFFFSAFSSAILECWKQFAFDVPATTFV